MSKSASSKELIRFFKNQSSSQDDIQALFEIETDVLAVARFRVCIFILLVLTGISMALGHWFEIPVMPSIPLKAQLTGVGILIFFALLSFVPQFRKNCYAFTMFLALFIGGSTALLQSHGTPTETDQMAIYTLFFIMVGFLMPWGGLASAGICIPLYLFYPLGIFLSGDTLQDDVLFRSNIYLALYIGLAVLAAHMNEGMRYKEFILKKQMESENTLLQDYQTRLKRAYERVENLAVMDTLTEAYNRAYMTQWLNTEIYKDKECQEIFTILMFDLDGFKTINDAVGHQQGDRILRLVTKTVARAIPGRFLVFRYGGDEFCVVLPGFSLSAGLQTAEDIRYRVERDPDLIVAMPGRESLHITLSMGVTAASAAISLDTDFLIKWTDNALLESKRQGRNRIHVFDPDDRKIKSADEWKAAKG